MADVKAWVLIHNGKIPAYYGNLCIYATKEDAKRNPDGVAHNEIVECTITWEEKRG
jgi:hypothetical protein